MKLLSKQVLAYVACTLFTACVAAISLWGVKDLVDLNEKLLSEDMQLNALANKFSRDLLRSRVFEKEFFVIAGQDKIQEEILDNWADAYGSIQEETLPELEELLSDRNDSILLAMVNRAQELLEENEEDWLIVTEYFQKTGSYGTVSNSEYGLFIKRSVELVEISDRLVEMTREGAMALGFDFHDARGRVNLFIIIVLACSIFCGAIAPVTLIRGIRNAVREITIVADQLSSGQMGVELKIKRNDELGELASAVKRLHNSMRVIISKFTQPPEETREE